MDTTMPQDPQFTEQHQQQQQQQQQQHLQCLKLAGLLPKTIEAYARAIRRIGNYFDCKIDNLSSDQLREYFTELLDTHSWSAVKLDLYGLKFFSTHVLHKPWEDIILIKPPKTSRIPDILSTEQGGQLFAATKILSYKVFFFTCYSMGLRLGETIGSLSAILTQTTCGSIFVMPRATRIGWCRCPTRPSGCCGIWHGNTRKPSTPCSSGRCRIS